MRKWDRQGEARIGVRTTRKWDRKAKCGNGLVIDIDDHHDS